VFPCAIERIDKVLNFKIGFQDLEKVLNLAKMSLRYWKSMEIPSRKDMRSVWVERPLITLKNLNCLCLF